MKRKSWFEKIDATSALPNFYPYSEDSTDTQQSADLNDSFHLIFENSENIVPLNNWSQDDQVAV
ncbi:MAG TPA: hypothetical protein EYN91_11935 [Candidatus Melainabacteria bacterium]|jgi:hypothetical protein|nr:hypothetical protein [Candidatus Melainabacteria bacterium]HIN67116.1 hypothetical protein [Candidatus Obscuribacterales bacterium]